MRQFVQKITRGFLILAGGMFLSACRTPAPSSNRFTDDWTGLFLAVTKSYGASTWYLGSDDQWAYFETKREQSAVAPTYRKVRRSSVYLPEAFTFLQGKPYRIYGTNFPGYKPVRLTNANQSVQPGARFPRRATLEKTGPPLPYDEMMLNRIEEHWFDLVDSAGTTEYRPGKILINFRLDQNGTVSDLQMVENTCAERWALLCQKAVLDLQPFPPWPEWMKKEVNRDYRMIHFTFTYR